MQEWLTFHLYNSFIEIKFTCHKSHTFKVHKVVLSSTLIPKGFLCLFLPHFIYFILFLLMPHCVTIVHAQNKPQLPSDAYFAYQCSSYETCMENKELLFGKGNIIWRKELVIKFRIMVLLLYSYSIWQNFLMPPFIFKSTI